MNAIQELPVQARVLSLPEKQDDQTPQQDARRYARIGWLIIIVGFVGFMLWAALAPLDKGVPVNGTVVVSGNRKSVEHPTGGIIDRILVEDGDHVQSGQVLVSMNTTMAASQLEVVRTQWESAKVIEARLIAERDQAAQIDFSALQLSGEAGKEIHDLIVLQQQLFESRKLTLDSELGALAEGARGLKASLSGIEASYTSRQRQQAILAEQIKGMSALTVEGYYPRNRLLDTRRQHAEIQGQLASDRGAMDRTRSQIAELELRASLRVHEFQKEVSGLLSDTRRDIQMLNGRLRALEFDLANTQIRAPVTGTVIGLEVFTEGGVIAAGVPLMQIVPNDEPLEVQGQIPVNLIDKVSLGLEVELLFTAFNQSNTPRIPAKVILVSPDSLEEAKTGMPYYNVKARVTDAGMGLLSGYQIRAGMPVQLFIKTGERTLLNYLVKPILDRARTALAEE